jgi:hypothetical protein
MFYYLYQIRNLINDKIYVGVHKTKKLDDEYMGSGKILLQAYQKYGIENFKKDILEYFTNSTDMFNREKAIVTDEFLLREDTYNLRRGGQGGFDYINNTMSIEERKAKSVIANKALSLKMKDPEYLKSFSEKMSKARLGKFNGYSPCQHTEQHYRMLEKAKSIDAILKRKVTYEEIGHAQGEKNSQFGKIWITNGTVTHKVKKDSFIPYGWKKGRTMKNDILKYA